MREQFPLKVSFAMTINKSQGQSVFTHGQLYLAMSRVASAQGMTILLPTNNPQTGNVVYPEVVYRETT
ncbi:ATP-dependent DNA helicase PIF1 [Mucor ambiguus]|uniref:ATP-dependent DNA helicase PIF1 n=1 Tax=Mucor ambiguus TaxID=91626 RepID=A0A0C9LYT8_9FUNG|nr:ATP-dependent DNA helicase PIF1 [Mucor ambiguus]